MKNEIWCASIHLGFRIIIHDGAHDGNMQNKTYKKLQLFKISTGHSPQFTQKEKLTSRMNRCMWHILRRLMAKETTSTFIYLALIYLTSGWAGLLSLVLHPELQNLWWNVCQLFAEGKKDLCSLSFLIIVPRVLHVCLEKLKYVRSKSIILAGLPFSIFCSLLWTVGQYPGQAPGTSSLDHCAVLLLVSSQAPPLHLAKSGHNQNQLSFSGRPPQTCSVHNVTKHGSHD